MDIRIYDNGTGGDFILKNGDLVMCDGLLNESYLSHFGGNTEAITTGDEADRVERFDWWGNQLMVESKHQMNSLLEKSLSEVTINTSGRKYLENQCKDDLNHLSEFAKVESNVYLDGNDRIRIVDKINSLTTVIGWNDGAIKMATFDMPISDSIIFGDGFTDGFGETFIDGNGETFF